MGEKGLARSFRAAIARSYYALSLLSKKDATELLNGCLTPGDESTYVDDSNVLDMSHEDYNDWLAKTLSEDENVSQNSVQ